VIIRYRTANIYLMLKNSRSLPLSFSNLSTYWLQRNLFKIINLVAQSVNRRHNLLKRQIHISKLEWKFIAYMLIIQLSHYIMKLFV